MIRTRQAKGLLRDNGYVWIHGVSALEDRESLQIEHVEGQDDQVWIILPNHLDAFSFLLPASCAQCLRYFTKQSFRGERFRKEDDLWI